MPLITIVSAGMQTKGFEISDTNKSNLSINYPKCQSPVSGRASPNEQEESSRAGNIGNVEKGSSRLVLTSDSFFEICMHRKE